MSSYYPPPTKAEILLTRGCNLSCSYCQMKKFHSVNTNNKLAKDNNELSDEEWGQVPFKLKEMGVPFAPIYGAEPLTRLPALLNFVESCKKVGIATTIITNSTLLNDDVVNQLVKAGLDSISLSNDISPCNTSLTYKTAQSEAWLDKLLPLFKDVSVVVTVNRLNITFLPSFVRRMNKKGIWVCMDIYHPNRGQEGSKCRSLDRKLLFKKEHEARIKTIMSQLAEMKKNGALIHPTVEYFNGFSKNYERYILNYGWKCTSGAWCTIDSDGSVYGCDDFQPTSFRGKFNILGFGNEWTWFQFVNKWRSKLMRCPGCYWSTHVLSDQWYGTTGFMSNQTHNRIK